MYYSCFLLLPHPPPMHSRCTLMKDFLVKFSSGRTVFFFYIKELVYSFSCFLTICLLFIYLSLESPPTRKLFGVASHPGIGSLKSEGPLPSVCSLGRAWMRWNRYPLLAPAEGGLRVATPGRVGLMDRPETSLSLSSRFPLTRELAVCSGRYRGGKSLRMAELLAGGIEMRGVSLVAICKVSGGAGMSLLPQGKGSLTKEASPVRPSSPAVILDVFLFLTRTIMDVIRLRFAAMRIRQKALQARWWTASWRASPTCRWKRRKQRGASQLPTGWSTLVLCQGIEASETHQAQYNLGKKQSSFFGARLLCREALRSHRSTGRGPCVCRASAGLLRVRGLASVATVSTIWPGSLLLYHLYLSLYLFIYLCLYFYLCLCNCLSISLSTYLPTYLPICVCVTSFGPLFTYTANYHIRMQNA